MTSKIVDVFNASGAKLFTYSIALEDAHCLDAEFEEVALIMAESSGLVAAEETARLSARCDTVVADDAPAPASERPRPKRQKNAIVSLVKHRMTRAGTGALVQSRRRAS